MKIKRGDIEEVALEEDATKEEIALLEQEEDYAEETSVETINMEGELNEKTDSLKGEFAKPFSAKSKGTVLHKKI